MKSQKQTTLKIKNNLFIKQKYKKSRIEKRLIITALSKNNFITIYMCKKKELSLIKYFSNHCYNEITSVNQLFKYLSI